MTGRRVAIAVGVAAARPLPYLGAAVNGARAFHQWASQLGYESKLVTDEDQPVTLARLRSEFETALASPAGPIHRLIIYFAGHGLIREAEEGLWLLSDWNNELRAVAVEGLKRRLCMHDINQIAIFSDSCRSVPPDFETADLTADPVLGAGPHRDLNQPYIDKFIAAQDGAATFMIPGPSPEEDRCLFSGLLMEALWGTKPGAFSTVVQGKITSSSLRDFLKAEAPKLAAIYKRKLNPAISPDFPDGDNAYFPEGKTLVPPEFPPWPPPDTLAAMGPSPAPTKRGRPVRAVEPWLADKISSEQIRQAFESRAGFAVEGAPIRALWTPDDVVAESRIQPDWWPIRDTQAPTLRHPAPTLIEFTDGIFAAVTGLPNFVTTVVREGKGIPALIYQSVDMPANTTWLAKMALTEMDHGALRADKATDMAIDLRMEKHADPVLGVISAYLYDSIGDIDNIRRMAFYYTQYFQPIPYDIALLARLPAEWRDGRLWASVPAVHERKPRTEAERLHQWTYAATPEATGEVGGFWPWMRQGWTFLEDHGSALIRPGLIELIGHLARARFTSFDPEGGVKVAKLFKLAAPGR